MKYEVVKTLQGKVVVDKSADVNVNDWMYSSEFGIYMSKGKWKYLNEETGTYKIVASINFSINKDVPMVVVEDVVKELAFKKYGKDIYAIDEVDAFIAGYKAAQEGGTYSESIVRDTISKSRKGMFLNEGHIKEYIDSLKQEYIELEMEIVNCYDDHGEGQISYRNYKEIIKTDTVDGQLIAYLKK